MIEMKKKKETYDRMIIEESIKKIKYLRRNDQINFIYAGEYYHRQFYRLKYMIEKAMQKYKVKKIFLTMIGMGRFYLITRVQNHFFGMINFEK